MAGFHQPLETILELAGNSLRASDLAVVGDDEQDEVEQGESA